MPAIRFVALLGLCAAYLQGGLTKLLDFGGAVAEVQHFGLPFAPVIAGATIVTELTGSALILSGVYRWVGAIGLAGFVGATPKDNREESLPRLLFVLTVVAGFVDAVSYLQLMEPA